ncbi:MAG: amidohydrolase family protein [Planctomycetaceae bacterium]|nr:amidohydrolase family protein [Planctomycetaceae bacterium]
MLLAIRSGLVLFVLAMTPVGGLLADDDSTRPVAGLHENPPSVHALTNARIVLAPGQVLEKATLVVRGMVIEAVGVDVQIPEEAEIRDLTGNTIYPGFIDAFSELEIPAQPVDQGAAHWNLYVQSQRDASTAYVKEEAVNKQLRSQGITTRLVAPKNGIIKGTSALVTTSGEGGDRSLLADHVAMHAMLTVPRSGSRKSYPNSPMGAVALLRQTLYDARWYRDAWQVFQSQAGVEKPETNVALEALQTAINGNQIVLLEAPDEQYLLRADAIGKEFGLNVAILGSGEEYRRIGDVRQARRPIILPLDFPAPPNVSTVEAAREVTLEALMHWDHAPENAARLQQAGVSFAFTSHGLKNKSEFLAAVRKAVQRGLPADEALKAMTIMPAQLWGVQNKVGSIAEGKIANLCVADGNLLEEKAKVISTWVSGHRYEVTPEKPRDLRGNWLLQIEGREMPAALHISGKPAAMKIEWSSDQEDGKSLLFKKIKMQDLHLTATLDADLFGESGVGLFSAVVMPGSSQMWRLDGRIVLPSGREIAFVAQPDPTKGATDDVAAAGSAEDASKEEDAADDSEKQADEEPVAEASDEQEESKAAGELAMASYPVNQPLGAFGRLQRPEQPELLALTNATVWSCGPKGIVENATLLIRSGLIERIQPSSDALPESAIVIDCSGKHISPGIIDCHSHMATDGGVNESGQAITAEVRIGDFIDARDISIYRQLAGGVTTSNILHGSANPIGGQNQVIKLRWGATPEEMKFATAPSGIKFALGENVKQSNWGSGYTTRYPKSRMGVEQLIRDAFLAARQYRDRRIEWKNTHRGLPPRRDLELDALVEILEGNRWIHCHSYRQDEILALLRTLETFQVQIGTLQHILEGYKVAEVMKRHGAMASAFSDWWAYKIEVYDAIPYNGALMHDMGIVVSFNSDDQELARHLNHEAAKAVKYGGVAPEEALKFVTLNPAKQLRIEEYVGSLESGKHADFVVWNESPLSTLSRCEQTWLDGRKYFDISEDRLQRSKWSEMRSALIQKILVSGQKMQKEGDKKTRERDLWPRINIYCRGHYRSN